MSFFRGLHWVSWFTLADSLRGGTGGSKSDRVKGMGFRARAMRKLEPPATASREGSVKVRKLTWQLKDDHGQPTVSIGGLTLRRAVGEVIQESEYHYNFKSLRDRINALSTFFGDAPLDVDFRSLGKRSEQIKRVAARFEWIDCARASVKPGQRHELSGFVSEATNECELEEFLPWLLMGALLHVGKHAPWGNGGLVCCTDS